MRVEGKGRSEEEEVRKGTSEDWGGCKEGVDSEGKDGAHGGGRRSGEKCRRRHCKIEESNFVRYN